MFKLDAAVVAFGKFSCLHFEFNDRQREWIQDMDNGSQLFMIMVVLGRRVVPNDDITG